AAAISKSIISAKIQNCRTSLLRSARDSDNESEKSELQSRAEELSVILRWLDREAATIDAARGFEGRAATVYFGSFS
ncbi:CRISPR-associated endonuclease Cas1, partial [Escherichia coli]|nr:CRISPR-associated endonuclease Cas1 [Escherichia coli]